MTDERIKEERNKTAKIIVARLLGSLEATPLNISMIETVLVEYETKITRTAERLAKIEVLESAKIKARECYFPWYVYDLLDDMISELKEAILSSPVKEGKTDAEKLAIAVKAFEVIRDNTLNPAHTMTKLGLEETTDANHLLSIKALKEIQ